MIIATAGHVDHGKTTLIRALTGTDTDRQAEEKRRGLSIDLGFAWADTGTTAPLGFVDVPGHERFLRNMLAGVAAVDFVLLVVAADDGPMPQTLEHLAILDLLGTPRGAVAITRCDRVTPARIDAVSAEIRDLLAPTCLREAALFPVSGPSGEGVPALLEHLRQAAATTAPGPAGGHFRLSIDRCFTVRGSGCVVTGTVLSGQCHSGDRLLLAPTGDAARVRGIEVHGVAASGVRAGERCALNLAGDLETDSIRRGDWLVAPELKACCDRLDVSLRLLQADAALPRGQIQLHLGAAVRNGRVVTLGPADTGDGAMLVQVVLDAPVHSVCTDRVILRDPAANRTLGGGPVVDPLAPRRGRSSPPRVTLLRQLARAGSVRGALEAMLATSPTGVELDPFARRYNLLPEELEAELRAADVKSLPLAGGRRGLPPAQVTGLCRQLLAAVVAWHDQHPDSLGPTGPELARLPGLRLSPGLRSPGLCHALLDRLLAQGELARSGFSVHRRGHRPRLKAPDQALLDRITGLLEEAGLRPPIVGDLALDLGLDKAELLVFLERAHHLGLLVRVAPNRYFLPPTLTRLARIAVELAGESPRGSFDARQYRDRSGIGRNLTIQVLEYLDRAGVTAFINEERRIQPGYTGPESGKDLDPA